MKGMSRIFVDDRTKTAYFEDGIKIVFLFLIYFSTAKFGLSFDAVSGFATLIWIPSGVALAFLFLFGYRFWPAIYLAAFLVNYINGASFAVALGIGAGNTLEAVTGTYLLKHSRVRRSFGRLDDVLKFFIIVPISAAVSATMGVFSLALGGIVSTFVIAATWQAWWVGDLISMLILTPFLLLWSKVPVFSFQLKRIVECFFLIIALVFVTAITSGGILGFPIKNSQVSYIVFPPLMWAALRFGQRGAVTSVFVLSLFAIIESILGFGPFSTGRLNQRLLYLQMFMAVIAVTAMVLAAVDTERRKFEQRKDDFISLASHELKNPLTSIKVFAQLARRMITQKQTGQAGVLLGKVDGQVRKLDRLINDLLDVSKIQAGKLEFQRKNISITKLINDTVETVQTTTKTHTIFVKNNFKQEIFIYADEVRIGQVITNLLTNAIKYSPQANKVEVSMYSHPKEIIVCVKDFGIGMNAEQLENVFQRYYRGHQNDEKKFPGLGIGLYISREILKRNKGNIWVESKKGKGSVFCFSLPVTPKKKAPIRPTGK